MQPKWFRLLYEQQYGHAISVHGGVGLTPSFLVGAMRTPPGEPRDVISSRGELSALLESMRDNVSGKLVGIGECRNLRQPRASLAEVGALGHLGDAVLLSDGSPSKLYAWRQYFARPSRDIESLGDGLWNLLESSISEGRFSYRGGTWQKFDEDDLAFIRRAFENDEA